ncbi:MAG: hypothetical protein U0840_02995 [Gemmataceae bacterium]
MTHEEAIPRAEGILAHAWMVRTFLKHADEAQEDEEILEVHRTIFDVCRAVEPAKQRNDAGEYIQRLRGKLSKLRRAAVFFADNFKRVTDHTNWQMAALSLSTCVTQLEELLAQVPRGMPPAASPSAPTDPLG